MSNQHKKKPYKSLAEIYLEQSFAKPVPELPRRTVLGEAKVHITFDDGRVKEIVTSDYTASKLLGVETKITSNINELVKQWFQAGGWGNEAIGIGVPLLMTIIERNLKTNNTGVVKEVIEDINNILKIKKSLNNFKDSLSEKNYSSFVKNFPVKLKQLSAANLIKDIEKNLVFMEGSVAVGPGEVLATLYSEMVNPEKGDLMFRDGRKVEVKGSTTEKSGGRPGSKSVVDAATRVLATLRKEYGMQLQQMDMKTNEELKKLFSQAKEKIDPNVRFPSSQKNKSLFIDITNRYLTGAFNLNNIKEIGNLKAFAKAGDVLTRSNIGTQILNQVEAYKEGREGKEMKTFTNYFNTTKDPVELANKIVLFSVHPENVDKNLILKYINNIGDKFDSSYAAKIVSAIQIADYQAEEKFSYIIFFNGITDNQVVIGEFSSNYNENLNKCIVKSFEFKNVSPGTGGTVARGGFNVIV